MARSKNVDDYNSLKGGFKEFGRKQKAKKERRAGADVYGLGGYDDDPPEDKVSKSKKKKETPDVDTGSSRMGSASTFGLEGGMTRGQKRRDERALGAPAKPAKPQTADDAMAALTDDKIGQDIATSGAAYRQEVAPVKAAAAAAKAPGTQEAKMLADLGGSDLSYNPSVKDPQVEVMQKALQAAGYSIQVDGRFGPNTQAAVEDFQRKMQVPVTGVADAATRESLAQTAGGDVGMMGTDFVKPGAGRRGTGAAAATPAVAAAEPAAAPAPAPAATEPASVLPSIPAAVDAGALTTLTPAAAAAERERKEGLARVREGRPASPEGAQSSMARRRAREAEEGDIRQRTAEAKRAAGAGMTSQEQQAYAAIKSGRILQSLLSDIDKGMFFSPERSNARALLQRNPTILDRLVEEDALTQDQADKILGSERLKQRMTDQAEASDAMASVGPFASPV
jgi:hypothetical protein